MNRMTAPHPQPEYIVTEESDKILAANRKIHRIVVFNIDSEIRAICFPNYRRKEKLMFDKCKQEAA